MLNVLSRRYFKDIFIFIFLTFYLGRKAEDDHNRKASEHVNQES